MSMSAEEVQGRFSYDQIADFAMELRLQHEEAQPQ
jgi:hypothetical protein